MNPFQVPNNPFENNFPADLLDSAREHPLVEWQVLAKTSAARAQKARQEFIDGVEEQTLRDGSLRGEPPFAWIAFAFADLYGEPTTFEKKTVTGSYRAVRPEFKGFIQYASRIDPAFPGWQCSDSHLVAPYVVTPKSLAPCFKSRIESLREIWRKYQSLDRPSVPQHHP